MSPSDAHSSLAALRQLQELLDAGTITPIEFDALKRQLIFGSEPAAPTPPPGAEATPTVEVPDPAGFPTPPRPEMPTTPAPPAPVMPDWLAAAAPGLPFDDESTLPPLAERRNPLTAVFIVGGILVLLGIVLFLFLDRPKNPDEHLTSATQTAADSVATVPEVGPQAEQITLPPTSAPETIRVAPVVRPTSAPIASQPRADSVATAPATAAPVSKMPAAAAPASKAPAAKSADTPADSTTKTP